MRAASFEFQAVSVAPPDKQEAAFPIGEGRQAFDCARFLGLLPARRLKLAHRFRRLRLHLREMLYDRSLAIATMGPLKPPPAPPDARNIHYEPLGYLALSILSARLAIGSHDVFFDLGAGKGRVICWFAREPLARCVGVELDATLAGQAQKNADRLLARQTPIEIRVEDAAATDLSAATIVFMYNPFGAEVVRAVLANLAASVQAHPRTVTVIYVNPAQRQVFDRFADFRQIDEFQVPYLVGAADAVVFAIG